MEGVKGYDTLMIDARGMGESEGVTTYRGASVSVVIVILLT